MNIEVTSDELRDEYQFDYSKAKRNRFASVVNKEGQTAESAEKPFQNGPKGDGMSIQENLRKLHEEVAKFTRDRDLAEAKVAQINPKIDQLCKSNMVAADRTIIGPIVHCVEACGESERAQYLAAGIQVGGGVGAFSCWVDFGEKPDQFTTYEFIPFEQCPPVAKARLAPHIDELLSRLIWELRT